MDAEYANYYTREVMLILVREFQSPDEEMKKIVLKVVKQCCATDGVESEYIKSDVLPPFFKHFWNPKMAMDKRNYRQVPFLSIPSLFGSSFNPCLVSFRTPPLKFLPI